MEEKCKVPCIITGTRAYGPHNNRSDIDIVLKAEDANVLQVWLHEKKISMHQTEEQKEYAEFGGFYFFIDALCFNIIVAEKEDDFANWEDSTLWMRENVPIENRVERIDLFRSRFHDTKKWKHG